jgi:LmbE family N-acetylglucosaminyl deacetylase
MTPFSDAESSSRLTRAWSSSPRSPAGRARTAGSRAGTRPPGSTREAAPVAARREEDREALGLLAAAPVWLDFCDPQYGPSPSVPALARPPGAAVGDARPTAVVFPLGLFHSDHTLVHEAALAIARDRPALAWYAYADAIYRRIPGLVERRLATSAGSTGVSSSAARRSSSPSTSRPPAGRSRTLPT